MTLAELVYSLFEVREASKEGEVWLRCPFCGDEKFRFGINVNNGYAHCFRGSCEWKTKDKRYLFNELCKIAGVEEEYTAEPIVESAPKPKNHDAVKKVKLPSEFEPLWRDVDEDVGVQALDYLFARGVTSDQIKKHKLGFCATGKYAYRVIFPILYKKGVYGFTGRDITGKAQIKYLNSESTKIAYNIPRFRQDKAVLVEGPIDALAVERASTHCDAIGRLGAGLSKASSMLLRTYSDLIVWPDPDEAGIELAIKTCVLLSQHTNVSIIMPYDDLETDTDPGKLGETKSGLIEIRERIQHRVPWSESAAMKLRVKVGAL